MTVLAERTVHDPVPAVNLRCFLPFYLRVAPRAPFAAALERAASRAVAPDRVASVVDTLWEAVLASVEGHAYRTLLGAFHTARAAQGLPADPGADTALTAFTAHLDGDGTAEVLALHPVLDRRLRTVVRQMTEGARELLDHVADDRQALHEVLGVPAGARVTDVRAAGSDPHNGNRRVWFVTTDDGTTLVHKPRPADGDDLARDLLAAVGPHLVHDLSSCLPPHVHGGDHGWQLLVRPTPMTSPDQVGRYFYRFGALTALLSAVGATDLHDENLLACGEHPTVVDTETLLRADAGVDDDTLPNTLINHMKCSVTSTMLLPMSNPDSVFDILLSGAGVLGEQQSRIRNPHVVDDGTDAIRVEWRGYTHTHSDNVPRLADRELAIVDHVADVLRGYDDALDALADGAVEEVLERHGAARLRSVMRSTEVYSRFLDASTHPKYLGRQEDLDALFGHLRRFHQKLRDDQGTFLQEREAAALRDGDVPWFGVRADATGLDAGGVGHPTFYRTSARDFARRGVRSAVRRSRTYHHFLVEECLGDVTRERGGLCRDGVFRPAVDAAAPGTFGHAVLDVLAELAVPLGDRVGWLGGIGPDRGAATVTPGNFVTFHDMGGIARAFRRGTLDDPRHADLARRADAGLRELWAAYPEVLDAVPESVYSGRASQLLAMPELVDDAWLARVVDLVAARGARREHDVANGPAGLLVAVLSLAARDPGRFAADTVRALRALAAEPLPDAASATELAHGRLGRAWATARTAGGPDGPGPDGLRALADRVVQDLAEHPPAVTGWCKGAAGALVAGADVCAAGGRTDRFVDDVLPGLVAAATRLEPGPVDLSVCHGTSGVVQALVHVASVVGRPDLRDAALDYQDRVVRHARREGWFVGAAGRTSTIGYMVGWAGVADTDLLLTGRGGEHGVPAALTC